jgi:adenosylmethionine-8-amino-7-oxononanoate aminotransferase
VGSAEEWAKRDAAVVWHGFTQMAGYTESSPVVVESASGHELVDVDGRHYLDAISSLWVTTLGHRVSELDQAVREQLDRVAHSTMLGNGNRTTIELAEALARVVPVDGPHFLFASDGAAAVEQALKIAFQYWVNRDVDGRTTYLAFGGAYHGDTVGGISVGAGGFGTDLFDPLRFPVLRAPGFADPDCFAVATDMIAEHGRELAAVVVEPLVQGAAGMQIAPAPAFGQLADACHEHGVLLVCDEVATGFGRTGTLFASEQCGIFDAFLGPDLSERTLYHGHSYGGNALACAVAARHLELLEERDVLGNVCARSEELRAMLGERVASHPAVREVRLQGLMGGVELAPPRDGLRWGRRVCAAAVERGVLLRPLGDVVVVMPPLTITSPELRRIVDALEGAIDEVAVA